MKTVLIAGGTGLIGKRLTNKLTKRGFRVYKLTRRAKKRGQIYWNPKLKTIEGKHLKNIQVIINLAGENIGEKRWTKKRKEALSDSRIETTRFLFANTKNMSKLEYYLGASGINCYAQSNERVKTENSLLGNDFLSNLVREWENASNLFSGKVPCSILRIAGVLDKRGGMLQKMKGPVNLGLGSALGNGNQYIPWIHIEDLTELIIFCIERNLEGTYNAVASCNKNKEFIKTLALAMRRPVFMPRIPEWILKFILGERSILILGSVNASNQKILDTGFKFKYDILASALKNIIRNNSNS